MKLNWLRRVYWINMSGTSISGYGAVSLMASCCSHIQFLFLSECANLDNKGIYSIVNLTTQLRRLDISHCPKVNRFGLLYLAEFNLHVVQNCLELLDVSHCGANQQTSGGAASTADMNDSASGMLHQTTPSPQPLHTQQSQLPPTLLHAHSTSAPPPLAHVTAAQSSLASQQSAQLVCVSLFNALEERGFKGTLVWQKYPRKEELIGKPQVIQVPVPPTLHGPPVPPQTAATSSGGIDNAFAPPVQAPQYQLQLSSPFLQHYQLQPHRIIDLAMRDITAQVLTEIPWEWIKAQDKQRAEKLARHHLQLGSQPNIVVDAETTSSTVPRGFAAVMEAEMQQQQQHGMMRGDVHSPPPLPRFYALNLSGHLINDRLLFYILINWGPRLYSLTLDGIYITSAGLRELAHCTHLHLLSLTSCMNLINKSAANLILKDSLRSMLYLAEINLTNSRLSGRMMSSHPNLKLEVLIANGCPISSFAIRMLASSAAAPTATTTTTTATAAVSTADGLIVPVAPPAPAQNMCKYSLRVLCLSGCAFINRRSVEYIFKFAYLTLLDVSDCKGMRASELMDAFRTQADNEIRTLESTLMGGGGGGTNKKGSKGAANTNSTAAAATATPSSFATLMCSLRHLICFGLSGAGMTDKRAADFQRDLNAFGLRLQQLLILQHHQHQAQKEAMQQRSSDETHNNLAPPMSLPGLRSTPPAPPAWLRRDFHADPILIVAQRNSPHIRHFQPTITRFVVQQQQSPQGISHSIMAIPAGIHASTAATSGGGMAAANSSQQHQQQQQHQHGSTSPPPIFRGSSLLDDCPYTYLPTPVANPPPSAAASAAAAAAAAASASAASSHVNPAHATGSVVHHGGKQSHHHSGSVHAPPVSAPSTPSHVVPVPFHLPSSSSSSHLGALASVASPAASSATAFNSYMMMQDEHAAGGINMRAAAAAAAAAAATKVSGPLSITRNQTTPQPQQNTWQSFPSAVALPSLPFNTAQGSNNGGGGSGAELYSVMQRTDMHVPPPRAVAGAVAAPVVASRVTAPTPVARLRTDEFGDEGVLPTRNDPVTAQMSALSIGSTPRPVPAPTSAAASSLQAYASVPTPMMPAVAPPAAAVAAAAPASVLPTVPAGASAFPTPAATSSLAFPSVGLVLFPAHAPLQGGNGVSSSSNLSHLGVVAPSLYGLPYASAPVPVQRASTAAAGSSSSSSSSAAAAAAPVAAAAALPLDFWSTIGLTMSAAPPAAGAAATTTARPLPSSTVPAALHPTPFPSSSPSASAPFSSGAFVSPFATTALPSSSPSASSTAMYAPAPVHAASSAMRAFASPFGEATGTPSKAPAAAVASVFSSLSSSSSSSSFTPPPQSGHVSPLQPGFNAAAASSTSASASAASTVAAILSAAASASPSIPPSSSLLSSSNLAPLLLPTAELLPAESLQPRLFPPPLANK